MPFSQEAHEILVFFARNKGQAYSVKDISRNLDRQRFREDRLWARAHLVELFSEGHILRNDAGYYYMPQPAE